MVSCIQAWNVKTPTVLVMRGAATDNNATLFAQGYNGVLQPLFDNKMYTKAGEPAGTWDPPSPARPSSSSSPPTTRSTRSSRPMTTTPTPSSPMLKTLKVPAKTFPTTGQDATLTGLQNVLNGYQCGTVYKAIYLAGPGGRCARPLPPRGQKPPATLVNGNTRTPSRRRTCRRCC
jgi:D-xylose transport system substrate-binding protein